MDRFDNVYPFPKAPKERREETVEDTSEVALQKANGILELYPSEDALYKQYLIYKKSSVEDRNRPSIKEMRTELERHTTRLTSEKILTETLAHVILSYTQGRFSMSPPEILATAREYKKRREGVQ